MVKPLLITLPLTIPVAICLAGDVARYLLSRHYLGRSIALNQMTFPEDL